MRGSPIRTSSDQRSVDSSPRLIAASYVLHRLLVPRHPPCALNNLATQKSHPSTPGRTSMSGPTQTPSLQSQKMLASTVQFSTYDQTPSHRPRRTHHAPKSNPAGQMVVREPERPRHELAVARSLRTQQRAYEPEPPPPPAFPTPKGGTSCSRRCRPNWSAFHPRAPPHTLAGTREWAPIPMWARLWTTLTRRAASAP